MDYTKSFVNFSILRDYFFKNRWPILSSIIRLLFGFEAQKLNDCKKHANSDLYKIK